MIKSYIELSEDEWENTFELVENHITGEGQLFETYGDELEFIQNLPDQNVWTLADGDDGGIYISEGMHFVNRIGYYVTAKPWSKESSYSICVRSGDCGPDSHEWEEFVAVDDGSVLYYICDACGVDKDSIPTEEDE
jgi:hypothetical protein